MNKRLKYSGTDKMSDLICENYNLLLVMSRFGLSLGFGDQTVQQVCERQGVHTGTFLAGVDFMDGESCVIEEFHDQISVEALMEYLKQAHSYFLDYNLPVIRRRLIDAIDCSQDDVAFLILKFYDEYVNEVRAHMETLYQNRLGAEYFKQPGEEFAAAIPPELEKIKERIVGKDSKPVSPEVIKQLVEEKLKRK